MSIIRNDSFNEIASKFSNYFQFGKLTSSYKPILLKAIFHYIKIKAVKEQNEIYLISIKQLVKFFFRFNIVLYKRFNLKQLNSKSLTAKIYKIIDEHFENDPGIRIPKEIPTNTIEKIISLLNRNVIYLLRRDVHIYDFYDENRQLIDLKSDIKDEQEFKTSLNGHIISYIGLSKIIVEFIILQLPILESAILANLAIFLERLNTVPNLNAKIMIADRSYRGFRNISNKDKQKIYEYQKNICFYCNLDMNDTPEADHFIPYNYLLDSEIWNIVGACQNCNRKKLNYFVEEAEFFERLLKRNVGNSFLSIFHDDIESAKKTVLKKNELLEQHYNNCKLYFKKISMK